MSKYIHKVIHLQLADKHYYFGSMKAMFTLFDKETLGITYDSLRHTNLAPGVPYENKKCIIREGELITSPNKQKNK